MSGVASPPDGRGAAPPSLALATARGAMWTTIGRLGSQLLQFAASVVLARLLAPSDFGVLASVLVFTQFSQIFFDMGMGQALVAMRDVGEDDLSTVFWLNALGGLVFAGLLAALGPALADFFSEPELVRLAPLVALSFTLNVGVVHVALLERALRFKVVAIAELSAAAIGLAASIGSAVGGLGVYSLGIGPAVQSLALSVIIWACVPWRPHRFVVRSALPRIWRFTGGMLGFQVVNYWGRNADNLLIGRFVGPFSLGLYNRAYNLMVMPVQQVSSVLGRVMLPALAAMKGDHVRIAHAYRRALRVVNALCVPVLVGIAAVAPALVPALWGSQWRGMVPLLMIVCLGGVPQCMGTSVGWIYQSQGRTGLMFRMGLVTSGLGVVAMVVAVHWGAIGVAWAVAARAWLFSLPSLLVACRVVDLSALVVLRDNGRTLAVAGFMGLLVWLAPDLVGIDRHSPAALLVQVPLGAAIYAVGCQLTQAEMIRDARALLLRREAAA